MPDYKLPNPLLTSTGTEVTTAAQLTNSRRAEVLELFRTNVYGRVPKSTYEKSFEVVKEDARAMHGAATLRQIAIRISRGSQSLVINVNLFLPNQCSSRCLPLC